MQRAQRAQRAQSVQGNYSHTQSLIYGVLTAEDAEGAEGSRGLFTYSKPYSWGFNRRGRRERRGFKVIIHILKAFIHGVLTAEDAEGAECSRYLSTYSKPYLWGFNRRGRRGAECSKYYSPSFLCQVGLLRFNSRAHYFFSNFIYFHISLRTSASSAVYTLFLIFKALFMGG